MVAESDTNYGRANAEFAYRSACLRLNLKANRLAACLKAGFRSDQPRVPAGNPDGGQWTRVPGWARGESSASGGRSDIAEPFRNLVVPIGGRGRRVRGGQVRVGSRWLPATPAQQARMQVTNNARRNAIAEVRKIDPNWKPRPQLFESVEGLIRANEAQRLEAELPFWN